MNLTNNTILITGGSSGIGLELSQRLLKKGNKIIICSRSEEKLLEVKKK
ncbi:MAG: SDR family NAD(P)-dependent oxidoreductase [Flavobacteriales bacterium]|nr:SDR family NAD(P)-dependent oxidoreductase [Flavobacteriales bacterium]